MVREIGRNRGKQGRERERVIRRGKEKVDDPIVDDFKLNTLPIPYWMIITLWLTPPLKHTVGYLAVYNYRVGPIDIKSLCIN